MAFYVSLINLTDQGIRNVKEAPERVRRGIEMAEKLGAKVHGFYLTMGQYDYVTVFEAPDDATVARLALALGMQGNVRTTTLKAFTLDEFEQFVKALP
jgi:uncharacterized protein with GYD domain